MPINHEFHSEKEDGLDPTELQPSHWNAGHTVPTLAEVLDSGNDVGSGWLRGDDGILGLHVDVGIFGSNGSGDNPGHSADLSAGGDANGGLGADVYVLPGDGTGNHGKAGIRTNGSYGDAGQVLTAQGDDTAVWDDPAGSPYDGTTPEAPIPLDPADYLLSWVTDIIPAHTYDDGTGGVGATVTEDNPADGVLAADGAAPAVGMRVVFDDNSGGTTEPGVFTVTATGNGVDEPWVLTRATDCDTPAKRHAFWAVHIDAGTKWTDGTARITGTADGIGFTAEGFSSHAEGITSHAEGIASHAEGDTSHAEGIGSHAEGSSSYAEGNYSHAEGEASHAEGYVSHAEGYGSHAEGYVSHAEGIASYAEGDYSHAEGAVSHAYAYGQHAHSSGGPAGGQYSRSTGSARTTDDTPAPLVGWTTGLLSPHYGVTHTLRGTIVARRVDGPIADTAVFSGGSGYIPTDTFTINAGNADATGIVDTVDANGGVLTFTVTNPGTGYSPTQQAATTATTGVGESLQISIVTTDRVAETDSAWDYRGVLRGNPLVHEIQRITGGGVISGGTWDLNTPIGGATDQAWNITAEQLQEMLDVAAPGCSVVTGGPLSSAPFTIEYVGTFAGQNLDELTVNDSNLTGVAPTLTPSTVQNGSLGSYTWVGGDTPVPAVIAQDAAAASWAVVLSISGLELVATVTGEDGKTIDWLHVIEQAELGANWPFTD